MPIRVGIIGAGWPATAHAKGYLAATGFKIDAVADLIPERRQKIMREFQVAREYADGLELIADREIDAVSICTPTHLHAPLVLAALKKGKHVICEKPPTLSVREAKHLESAAAKAGKVLLYAFQRRFGPHEQAAHQAAAKGYAGNIYHARAAWTRTRGIPIGTGWFTDKSRSGGGAMIDIGVHLLDVAWWMMGEPTPVSVAAVTHQHFAGLVNAAEGAAQGVTYDVEDSAFAIIRFEGHRSLELSAAWALNQPPAQNGTVCRLHGTAGAIDVYTPDGAVLYRDFDAKGNAKSTSLRPPRVIHHHALMLHFKACISGKDAPIIGASHGVTIMRMIEGIYKSAETGKTVVL